MSSSFAVLARCTAMLKWYKKNQSLEDLPPSKTGAVVVFLEGNFAASFADK